MDIQKLKRLKKKPQSEKPEKLLQNQSVAITEDKKELTEMLDKRITFDKLAIGERVRVTTKTGRLVCFGTVHSVYKMEKAVLVRGELDPTLAGDLKQVTMDHMYRADLYDFYAEKYEEEPGEDIETPVKHQVTPKDKSLIDGSFSGSNIKKEAEETEPDDTENDGEDGGEDKKGKKDTVKLKDKDVDVSKLPKEVQQQIKGSDSLDDDKIDIAMSKISDSVRQALKNAGVKDTEVYQMVVDVQKAIEPILKKKRK